MAAACYQAAHARLDPRFHKQNDLAQQMDCRVEPGNDNTTTD
jgi:hypothetical protein